METIEDVGVIGLGVMGFDIALLYALKGHRTHVYDASTAAMETLTQRRDQTVERLKRRNRITDAEAQNAQRCLVEAPDLGGMARLQLVTEAVSEVAKTKLAVYQALKEIGFTGILTTNTSSLTRASLLTSAVYARDKFISTHFFNPVLYTQMVEVVPGDMESDNARATLSFLKGLGRNPVETKDISGFVSNSILMYHAVMALQLLQNGGRIEAIDEAAKALGLLPPLISYDSWKPSIVEAVTRVMAELRGDSFLRSSKLLADLARDNPPFYVAQKPNPQIYDRLGGRSSPLSQATIEAGLRAAIHIAAARVVELGEDPARVDYISLEGLRFRDAPLQHIDELGASAVLNKIAELNRSLHDVPLAPPALLRTMADASQPFFVQGKPNPWIETRLDRSSLHARH